MDLSNNNWDSGLEPSNLISVSDVMAGLLFVFMITLVAFIINFQEAIDRQEQINASLTNLDQLRSEMLEEIQMRLVQRLTEDALTFESASAKLRTDQLTNLGKIRRVLEEVLPCYAAQGGAGTDGLQGCAPGKSGKLDSTFIEGHTDNVPIGSNVDRNWELSAQRAIYTYRQLVERSDVLASLVNIRSEPLFSVSGYGFQRAVVAHNAPTNEPRNRRIDLRFIMTPPEPVDPQIELERRGLD
jgi:outer membrane protein OmpA-like peptidoglycan-associated protein